MTTTTKDTKNHAKIASSFCLVVLNFFILTPSLYTYNYTPFSEDVNSKMQKTATFCDYHRKSMTYIGAVFCPGRPAPASLKPFARAHLRDSVYYHANTHRLIENTCSLALS
jgi:hypothetical protein